MVIVGHAQRLLAHELAGLVEAAGDGDGDHAPGLQMLMGCLLPAVAEARFGRLVVVLDGQPVVHVGHRVFHRQRQAGG